MKSTIVSLVFYAFFFNAYSQLPSVSSGTIKRYENFPSKFVATRNVDVWLPDGYSANKKYAVLYMHDGQMLFDSSTTWNHASWDVDDAITKLQKENKIKDVIVIAIWNSGAGRHADYFPQKPYESLSQQVKDFIAKQLQEAAHTKEIFRPVSDNYLKFIVEELKPFIDRSYSTYKDATNTFIAGSSMGGLISMYAICEYPQVFGGAACLSTHWVGTFSLKDNPVPAVFQEYLKTHLPTFKNHRIYFDCGDQALDAMYPSIQKQVDEIMKAKGYSDKNWATRYFPGEAHTETAWAKRLGIPLLFLLKNN